MQRLWKFLKANGWIIGVVAAVVFVFLGHKKVTKDAPESTSEMLEILAAQDRLIEQQEKEIGESHALLRQMSKTIDSLEKENRVYHSMVKTKKTQYEKQVASYKKNPVVVSDDTLSSTIAKLKAKYGIR